MARWIYVKGGGADAGTALDGGSTVAANAVYDTQKTGSWATAFSATNEYFESICDLVQATYNGWITIQDDDYILVSSDHNVTATFINFTILNNDAPRSGVGVTYMSVDDTDIEQYKPGAYEYASVLNEFTFGGNVGWYGIDIEHNDNHLTIQGGGIKATLADFTSYVNGSGDYALHSGVAGSAIVEAYNMVVDTSADSGARGVNMGDGTFIMLGGSLNWHATSTASLAYQGDSSDYTCFKAYGADLSGFSGTGVMFSITANGSFVELYDCLLPASFTWTGPLTDWTQRLEAYGCSASGDGKHKIYIENGSGKLEDNESVYVDAGEAILGQKFSYAVTTTSYCNRIKPFQAMLPTSHVDLTTTDELHVDIITANTLTDADIAVSVMYNDATIEEQVNVAVSPTPVTNSKISDPTISGTTLTNTGGLGASDWTGEGTITSPNYYRITIDTSGDPGSACVPRLFLEVYKASLTNPIFISTNPVAS